MVSVLLSFDLRKKKRKKEGGRAFSPCAFSSEEQHAPRSNNAVAVLNFHKTANSQPTFTFYGDEVSTCHQSIQGKAEVCSTLLQF